MTPTERETVLEAVTEASLDGLDGFRDTVLGLPRLSVNARIACTIAIRADVARRLARDLTAHVS